jgi:hypothetical protein
MGPLAPEVFRLSDKLLGTDFGPLVPPFGLLPAEFTEPSQGRA